MSEPTATNTVRLNRIEEKIDKMSEVIINLARVEEKIADLENRREEQHERINRLSQKIDTIDTHVVSLLEKVAIGQKFSWFFFASFVTGALTILLK